MGIFDRRTAVYLPEKYLFILFLRSMGDLVEIHPSEGAPVFHGSF
jgi:hypothetical protein